MRKKIIALALAVSSSAQAQNIDGPGKASPNLAHAQVFAPEAVPHTVNPNGSERWDILPAGALATGEKVHVHQSMQPQGAAPSQPHAIQHSELIVVQQGTLAFTHDGRTEKAGPGSVIYVAYGTMHQTQNIGPGPVRYTVIAIGGDAQ